ncbi:hypothetical protein N866_03245 [Actinotalea ferrariae CF5-4]|uniref:Uncharacterized protein n=1 Tax=Actinotalea ferrariae CF5-4 TaxID=948458 RepID=A0A021W0P0_9CELL|nr:hypothetical protein N866_03245 [Actinotalea ferrariae CF5-4]
MEDQVATWLRSRKQWDLDVTVDGTHDQPAKGRTVTVRHHRHGHDRAFRMVLEEDTHAGHWTTRITAVEHERGGGWVAIEVVSEDGLFVKVPGVARYLIEALHLADGGLELCRDPRIITADRLGELITVLRDPDRRAPVFVAGTDERLNFAPFVTRVKDWAAQVDGLGHVFVLDPGATAALAARLGRVWEAPAWTIRTYGPGLNLDATATAPQHRILSTQWLAEKPDRYLQTLVGGFARGIVARHKTPAPLAAWQRTFDRLENNALTEAMTSVPAQRPPAEEPARDVPATEPPAPTGAAPKQAPAPTVEPEPAPARPPLTEEVVEQAAVDLEAQAYLAEHAELERVRVALGLPDLAEETLARFVEEATAPRADPRAVAEAARRMERQQARIETLLEEIDELRDQLLAEQVELLEVQEQEQRQADRVAWLGQQLIAAGKHDLAYAVLPQEKETVYPSSYGELLERAQELEAAGVVIAADPGTALELDTVDSSGKALRNAWEALLVLGEYVRARQAGDCTGNVHQYLGNTPAGYRGMSPGKHAWTETGTTMNQYGDERLLPVPPEVSGTGFAQMRAHFKLGRIGMASPRLYYLDDVAGTGKVYVGYIGTHLTNTKTN